ncbi:hypothetical protein IIY68_02120 [Candidatus Saccharibacteria bacterium]|nr:hypothetical protein [Candidatus Saccharibacteria bacterium]
MASTTKKKRTITISQGGTIYIGSMQGNGIIHVFRKGCSHGDASGHAILNPMTGEWAGDQIPNRAKKRFEKYFTST